MNAAPTTPFEYLDIPITTDSPITFPDTVRDFRAANFQIQNTGAAPLTAMKLYSKAHPNAVQTAIAELEAQWVTGNLIVDIFGSPFTLAAGAIANIVINTFAQYQLTLTASCGTSTTLAVRGHLYGQGV